jgi:hypothetical protein
MSRVPRGMSSPLIALSVSDVREMRRRHSDGETYSALAREFNVSVETASNAVQGLKAYKEVK